MSCALGAIFLHPAPVQLTHIPLVTHMPVVTHIPYITELDRQT